MSQLKRAGSVRVRALAGLLAIAACAAGCGDNVDIKSALQIVNAVTGYFDAGIAAGKNKLVPSVSFQVKNTADGTVRSVQFNAVFRVIGDQEELGSALVRGIDASGLAAGAESSPYVMRSSLGYTGEQPRAEMLQHKDFRDVQVEIFGKHGSEQWVKLAHYKVERQLLTR